MKIVHHRQIERLRDALQGPTPSLGLLRGPGGCGKAAVVGEATREMDVVRYRAAPLPDPDHRALVIERLGPWGAGLAPTDDWPRIFDRLLSRAAERRETLRLVLEEFPLLVEARPKLLREVERFWSGVRAHGLPVHLVIAGSDGPVLDELRREEGAVAGWIGADVFVTPLGPREVGALFPGYGQRDRLLAWAIFGGLPRHLGACDPDVSLATNVRQAILSADARLLHEGTERLRLELQSPARYASLLRTLASGRREWGEILASTADFAGGGQMAPYLSRLQGMGLVESEASLDAAPGARQRRYRIRDPFLVFWYRFVLPHLTDLAAGMEREVWRRHVRPALDDHAALVFPLACRDHLLRHAHETLGADARATGGLWGAGYDIEPAGTLRTGAAVYGRALWGGGRVPETTDSVLQEEIRRTRYGFGKEARLRVVFATDGFAPALVRRAARSDHLHLLGPGDLLGEPSGPASRRASP